MHPRPVRKTVVAVALLGAGTVLTACGSSGPSASGPPTPNTAASSSSSSQPPSKSTPSSRLLAVLQQLNAADANLSTTLASMQTRNDAGTTYRPSDVESLSSSVANLLQLSLTELTGILPSLPSGDVAATQSFQGSLTSALKAFDNTDALANTAARGVQTPGVPSGLPSGLISSASGGPLIAQYQSDASEVAVMERTTEHQFAALLDPAGG